MAIYGLGLLVPAFTDSIAILIPIMLIVGFGGGLVMTLPYALLQPLMPERRHGALTGFYSASRGVGVMLGPLLGGVAVSAASGVLAATHGYAAMWAVCGAAALGSLPLVKRVSRESS